MSLSHLKATAMVSLTGPWVTPGHAERQALESTPSVAALFPFIEEAHSGILQAQDMSITDRMAPVVTQIGVTVRRLDSLWRVLHGGLGVHIQLASADDDSARAEALTQAQGQLMPQGLEVIKFSNRDKAGEVTLLVSRVDAGLRTLLDSTSVQGLSLGDLIAKLAATADELGRLEDRRSEIRMLRRENNMVEARAAWMRMITTVRQVLELAQVSNPILVDILARVRDAVAQAGKRADATADSEDGDASAPADDTGSTTAPAPEAIDTPV